MPALTRPHRLLEVYFGDLRVGTIARCLGNPDAAPQWQWLCGFYPVSNPGEQRGGTAGTFDQARTEFENDWRVFSAKRTEADYHAWRDHRDWTARKYANTQCGSAGTVSVAVARH